VVPNPFRRCPLILGGGSYVGKEVFAMAKTQKGKKVVPVKPYIRKVNGNPVKVKRHKRSTPD
jgi:hypothetical protein